MQSIAPSKSIVVKILFTFLLVFASTNLYAARTIIDANFGGNNNISVFFGTPIQISVTVVTDTTGPGTGNYPRYYRSLEYKIGNDEWKCASPNVAHTTANTWVDSFTLATNTKNIILGTHNLSLRAYSGTNCGTSGGSLPSDIYILTDAITITPKQYPLDLSHGIFSSTQKIEFSCDKLYIAADSVHELDVSALPPGNVVRPNGRPDTSYKPPIKELYRAYLNTPLSKGNVDDGAVFRTMALGPYGDVNGELTAFHWWWEAWGIPSNGVMNDDTIHRSYHGRPAFTQNGTNVMEYMTPVPPEEDGWSGGEVNQMSGEIYFSGREDRHFDSAIAYQFMIYNPITKEYTLSGRVTHASGSDFDLDNRFISSDMAIDAEGNFYVLVRDPREGRYYWLTRVVPSTTGNWKYNKVAMLGPFPTGTITDAWGMAFLNGKLYTTLFGGGEHLYESNPLTGETFYKGNLDGLVVFDVKDLATCQVAPIIRGKVYLDENGDGILSSEEKKADGIPNIVMQIYDNNGQWIGEQNTSGAGEYSFLVPIQHGTTTTYFIRAKQPQINKANTRQTWANGGDYIYNGTMGGTNKVTPVCYNGVNPFNDTTTQGKYPGQIYKSYDTHCDGAKSDGIDGSSNSINVANYYSKVEMTTDRAVAHADFAVAPTDRSDSPDDFKDASHAILKNNVFLGKGLTADNESMLSNDADKDDLDDGVLVMETNSTEPFKKLQNYTFQNNKNYTFRVYVDTTSPTPQDGYLHGWMNLKRGAKSITNDYNEGIKIADGIKMTAGNVSYYDFTYTIPDEAITNSNNDESNAFVRFRYSKVDLPNLNADSPERESALANTQPWAIDGEVEDYKVVYKYVAINPPVGNLTVVNEKFSGAVGTTLTENDKKLYTQISNLDFKTKLVYTDKDGKVMNPEAGITADIYFIDSAWKTNECNIEKYLVKVAENVSLISGVQELDITNIGNIAIQKGSFRVVYRNIGLPMDEIYSCASKDFTVRPDKFVIYVENNKTLKGEKLHDIRISAVGHSVDTTTKGYNQDYKDIDIDKSLLGVNCLFDENDFSIDFDDDTFKDGSLAGLIRYDNIGNVDFKMLDNIWATENCITDSTANAHNGNGMIGCDIADAIELVFLPTKFRGTLDLKNFNDGAFTYISNNEFANEIMSAVTVTEISVLMEEGGVATNYEDDCYAKDVDWTLNLTENPQFWNHPDGKNANQTISFYQLNGANAKATSAKNAITNVTTASVTTVASNFKLGTAENLEVGVNFERQNNKPQNPFIVGAGNFTINSIQDADLFASEYVNTTNHATFIYGRAFAKDVPGGSSPISVPIRADGFCGVGCKANDFGLSNIDVVADYNGRWYINSNHGNGIFGNVTKFSQLSGKNTITFNPNFATMHSNGVQTVQLTHNNPPAGDDIRMDTQSWLIYNTVNQNANYNQFWIEFYGPGGGWAGVGQVSGGNQTGRVIQRDSSNKTMDSLDW